MPGKEAFTGLWRQSSARQANVVVVLLGVVVVVVAVVVVVVVLVVVLVVVSQDTFIVDYVQEDLFSLKQSVRVPVASVDPATSSVRTAVPHGITKNGGDCPCVTLADFKGEGAEEVNG